MSFTTTYPFNTPANYIYDTDKIEVTGGKAQLKLIDNPGQDFVEEFLNDTGFTYNSLFAEFLGNPDYLVRQKDTRPLDALGYCSFAVDEEFNWQSGTGNNSLSGGATVSGGVVDLTGASGKRFNMSGACGFNSVGTSGCIRFVYIPDYNGNPTSTRQVLEYDTVSGNNGAIFIQHFANQALLAIDLRDSSGVAHQLYATGFGGFTQGQRYVLELNFDFDSTSRFFIDGIQRGSLNTSAWTRNASPGTFKWGGATGAGDCWLDDIIIFDSVQHTADHAGELPYTYYDYIYVENSVILPEMEWTGAGTLVSFDSFATTETGSPRYILQIGRSGDYLYWDGAAWAVSDGTYDQANSSTVFNANVASLNILGEIYGQVEIIFPNSNTQSDVSELTASLTAQIYPTDNPTIEPTTSLTMEELIDFDATTNVTGSDLVKYILKKGNSFYYQNGSAWVVSDGTYVQTNTLAEIQTNKSTFTDVGVAFKWKAYLHSDDGSTTPDIDIITVEYDFFASGEDINVCIVWGYNKNDGGAADDSAFKIQLSKDAVKYKDETILRDDIITVSPDTSTGYWEVELIETANMENGVFYNFTFGDRLYHKLVPNEATKNFWKLEDA